MNYIRHLNKVLERMLDDENLTSFHIALYMALFHKWNVSRFKNPVLFDRVEIMYSARIGSLTTYTRTIKELHQWEYLKYMPGEKRSGSTVFMYNMCTPNCTCKCTGICTCMSTHAVRPSVRISDRTLYIDNKHNKHKESERKNTPSNEEINKFFLENKSTKTEADKFFYHYEANGWIVGKENPMIDWKASAKKWILNVSEFNNSYGKPTRSNKPTAGRLHAGNNKDYSEPL